MSAFFIPKSIIASGAGKYSSPSKSSRVKRSVFAAFVGVLLGGVNGIFGAGGGMLAVPALTFILGYDDKSAHAAAIALILPLCAISVIVYSLKATFDMSVVLPTSIGVFIGGLIGAILLKKIPAEWLSFVFYGLMLFSGIKMMMG